MHRTKPSEIKKKQVLRGLPWHLDITAKTIMDSDCIYHGSVSKVFVLASGLRDTGTVEPGLEKLWLSRNHLEVSFRLLSPGTLQENSGRTKREVQETVTIGANVVFAFKRRHLKSM